MKTPLFLADKYCLSLNELKKNLHEMVSNDMLYAQVIAAVSDGTISRWLRDGTQEETKYANILDDSLKLYRDPAISLNRLCIELNAPTVLR